jgi:hypothetical protein
MSRYENLPSVNLEVLDGNLKIDTQPKGDAVIVVAPALQGPVNVPIALTDSNLASRVFGANSPLLEAASQVKLGGVENVYLYRVGGVSAKITGLFGVDSLIEVIQPSVEEESFISVYVGPRPLDATRMCLIVHRGTKIVYSNAPGAEVDLKIVKVSGFDINTTTRVGTLSAPVSFRSVLSAGGIVTTTPTTTYTPTVTPSSDSFTFDYLSGSKTLSASGATITGVTAGGAAMSASAYVHTTGAAGVNDTINFAVNPSVSHAIVANYNIPIVTARTATFTGDAGKQTYTLTGEEGVTVSGVTLAGSSVGFTFTAGAAGTSATVTLTSTLFQTQDGAAIAVTYTKSGVANFVGNGTATVFTLTGIVNPTVSGVTIDGIPEAGYVFTPSAAGVDAYVTLNTAPVNLAVVAVIYSTPHTTNFTADAPVSTFTLVGVTGATFTGATVSGSASAIASSTAGVAGASDARVTLSSVPATGASVVISYTTTALQAGSSTFTGNGVTTQYALAGVSGAVLTSVTFGGTAVSNASISSTPGSDDVLVFAAAPTKTAAIVVNYTTVVQVATTTSTTSTTPVVGAMYVAADNSISVSWKKYYELIDQALAELETTQAGGIYVYNGLLDAPNVADGSTAVNKLEYLRKVESFGEVSYEWSPVKTVYKLGAGTTNDPVLSDKNANGLPIIVRSYNEVNFGHRLGTWAYYVTENENFVFATVSTSAPASSNVGDVARWIGTMPQVDDLGNIVVNGSGLLGNKFMNGSIDRSAGFILTDNGFPDGSPQVDSNGSLIDLGKFMSVVPAQVVTPFRPSLGLANQTISAAPIYAGLIPQVRAGESTTNRAISNISLPYTIKKAKLNELSGSGYVMFAEKNGVTKVVSGDLATRTDSDYDYISTSIILATLITRIRNRLDSYLGRGLTAVQVAAMNTAVEGIFEDMVRNDNAIVKYQFSIIVEPVRNGAGIVKVPVTIVPAFELREVNTSVKLAYDV